MIWAKNVIIWAKNVIIRAKNVEILGQERLNMEHGFGPKNNRIWAKFGVLALMDYNTSSSESCYHHQDPEQSHILPACRNVSQAMDCGGFQKICNIFHV